MIKSITIYELFGEVGNKTTIEFNDDLTILVGKNGCGKTTILNILNSIFNSSYYDLWKYNFTKIEVKYENEGFIIIKFEKRIAIVRDNWQELLNNHGLESGIKKINNEMDFDILKKCVEDNSDLQSYLCTEVPKEFENGIFSIKNFMLDLHPLYFPTYRRTEIDFSEILWDFQDMPRNSKFYRDKIFQSHYLNNGRFGNTVVGISNKDIREIVRSEWLRVGNIETQKLNSLISDFFLSFLEINNEREQIDLKTLDAEKLNEQIKQIFTKTGLARIGKNSWSTKIDNYTQTIVNARLKSMEMDRKIEGSESLDKVLKHFNLINSITHSLSKITEIISIYNETCDSIESIKSPFKDLEEILTEFMYPKIAVIKEGELYFKKGNDRLDFEDLSAGEKQLITLFVYSNLATKDNSIVLIDEPELSLHITWQRSIVKNLLTNKKKIQFIISTHSPFVTSGYDEYIKKIGEIDYDKI